MRAMILAAGFGTRLRPLTDHTPKPLIDVAGEPMIAFPLRLLREAGIRDVVINLHHKGEQIRNALGDGRRYGVAISYSPEDPILDSGGGIAAARPFLEDDDFVLLNADTFIDIRLGDVIDYHRSRRPLVTMVLRPDPRALRQDDIGLDASGYVRRIRGHGATSTTERPLQRCLYPGVMVFDPRIFTLLPDGVFSITRDTFPDLLDRNEPIAGFLHEGYWRVLDTHEDLEAGRQEIANLKLNSSQSGTQA